ncbi:hypothetical protein GGR53DRAFT_530020 [Hypoxylon sp. FL1150]|nr:hypothetical protein GGR53DRAFT_530020 [Hypoxylon sp. FL1150]
MGRVSPLPFLVAPTAEEAIHEVILVHGFKGHSDKPTQVTKCRELLESWVLDAAKPIRAQVNIRIFVFDGAHILHHGHVALSEAAAELSERLEATRRGYSSPVFCPRVEDGNSEAEILSSSSSVRSLSSRASVFIAHGIGTWIVKELLNLLNSKGGTHIDPTGLIFLDVPNTLVHQASPDLRADYFLLEYLRELSRVFKLNAQDARIRNLRAKLSEVDHAFQKLTESRYGECESIEESEADDCTFNMKMWCEDVWMSTPASNKTFLQYMGSLFPCGKRSKVQLPLPRFGELKLEEKLRESISLEGYNSPISSLKSGSEPSLRPSTKSSEKSSPKLSPIPSPNSSYHTCFDNVPVEPTGDSEPGGNSSGQAKGAQSAGETNRNITTYTDDDEDALKDWRVISRYLARHTKPRDTRDDATQVTVLDRRRDKNCTDTCEPPDWPLRDEHKGKEKATVIERPPKIPEGRKSSETQSSRRSRRSRTDKNHGDDEVYDFDKAIIDRDAAVLLEDEDALQLAQHRLELVLWHQQQHFGKDHPKALITQRECIATSLVRGIWFVKPIANWEKKDLLEIESQMRQVYSGLEESLGPLDRETMVALAVLLSIRVSLVQKQAIPWEAMELVLDMLKERQGAPEARTPERLLHTLRTKYKVGISLTRIWRYGDAMLEELLKEIVNLEGRVDCESVEGLSQLRREVKAKIEGLQGGKERRGRSRARKRGRSRGNGKRG